MGLEPTVSCLASRRVNQLRYNRTRTAAVINEMLRGFPGFHSRSKRWVIKSLPAISYSVLAQSRQRDSNPQPTDYKSVALPIAP